MPETLMVPETVAPLAGAVMAMVGTGEATLMLKFAEAERPAASLTCTVKGKEPAREGVPEREPLAFSVSPLGRVPLRRLQV